MAMVVLLSQRTGNGSTPRNTVITSTRSDIASAVAGAIGAKIQELYPQAQVVIVLWLAAATAVAFYEQIVDKAKVAFARGDLFEVEPLGADPPDVSFDARAQGLIFAGGLGHLDARVGLVDGHGHGVRCSPSMYSRGRASERGNTQRPAFP